MIYARIAIYQTLKHLWKQSVMPEPAIFKIVKKSANCQSFILSRANSRLLLPLILVQV